MIHHETLYRASIYFEVDTGNPDRDVNAIERICNKALVDGRPYPGMKVSVSEGGPCWGPYLEFTGDDEKLVAKLADASVSYAKRFTGVRFM